jgi:hypothetical protein
MFVSPHGLGHAARASAVMEAVHRTTGASFELFSSSPRWFFEESVPGLYRYHDVVTDVGFRQRSALVYDLEATVAALQGQIPFDESLVDALAARLEVTGCRAVLCDIAPLGIAVAERAGLPSVLIESFTWPWLYEPLFTEAPALASLAEELDGWFHRASLHLLTQPFCLEDPRADGVFLPVSRPALRTREEIRASLGLEPDRKAVVITLGGFREALPFLPRLSALGNVTFLVTGAEQTLVEGNIHLFDNTTRVYMPDLVRASDAVVAKLGYSTVAETWREGTALAFISRADFRETAPLRDWVQGSMPGFEIPGEDFADGTWIARVPELLEMDRPESQPVGGADQVADYLRRWLSNRS